MSKDASILMLAVTVGLSATSAFAQSPPDRPGWYVALHAGMNIYDSGNTLSTDAYSSYPVSADDGYIIGAAAGYKPTTGMVLLDATRWEVEYSFRGNPLESVGNTPQSGDLLSHTVMANLLVDFSNPTIFTPYVGAGYGFSEFDFDGDDETAEAWQFLAGLDYFPVENPSVIWGMRYRYLDTEEGGIVYDDDLALLSYDNHSVEVTSQLRF